MKLFQLLVKALAVPMLITTTTQAQNNKNIPALIDAQNFVFTAQTVSPAYGNIRQLTTGDYTLSIFKDMVIADLPYFGRAYSAPIDPTQGGLQFKSKSFDYSVKTRKKEWDIVIKPHDAGEASQLYLTVFNNGTAYLQVVSNNRQPISFNGIIVEKK
jgi:hypothetical protein